MERERGPQIGDVLQIDLPEEEHMETLLETMRGDTLCVREIYDELARKGCAGHMLTMHYRKGDSGYTFEGRALRNEMVEGLWLTCIERVGEIVQDAQRRESYRLKRLFDIQLSRRGRDAFAPCQGLDISDTGISFSIPARFAQLEAGEQAECKFALGKTAFHLVIEVAWKRQVDEERENSGCRYGARFINSKESDRKQIRRFIYTQQASQSRSR